MVINEYIRQLALRHIRVLATTSYRGPDPELRKLLPMPAEEWTSDEADPYLAPDDPDNWEDEAE